MYVKQRWAASGGGQQTAPGSRALIFETWRLFNEGYPWQADYNKKRSTMTSKINNTRIRMFSWRRSMCIGSITRLLPADFRASVQDILFIRFAICASARRTWTFGSSGFILRIEVNCIE
ncbi:hypothetical protein CPT76_21775 [Paenibacillus sp. AR247]|nr:hypothetical protein CPT76_21775 [Paenibacillus sp. AR247]